MNFENFNGEDYWIIFFINLLIFILGVCFGSFYSYAKNRLVKDKSITEKRKKEKCKHCKKEFKWYHKIPIFSYIVMKGKCYNCDKQLSDEKIKMELSTGIIFLIVYNSIGLFRSLFIATVTLEKNELMSKIIFALLFPLIYTFIKLISYVEKETRRVNKKTLFFGTFLASISIIVKLILSWKYNSYNPIETVYSTIYLVILVILIWIQIKLKQYNDKAKYPVDTLINMILLTILLGSDTMMTAIFFTLLYVIIVYLFGGFDKIEYKENIKVLEEKDGKVKRVIEEEYKVTDKFIPFNTIIGNMAVLVVILKFLLI